MLHSGTLTWAQLPAAKLSLAIQCKPAGRLTILSRNKIIQISWPIKTSSYFNWKISSEIRRPHFEAWKPVFATLLRLPLLFTWFMVSFMEAWRCGINQNEKCYVVFCHFVFNFFYLLSHNPQSKRALWLDSRRIWIFFKKRKKSSGCF